MAFARQSTAFETAIGPVLDADGVAVTDCVVGDFKLKKTSGDFAALNASATLTHVSAGMYDLVLTTSDTDTVGVCVVAIDDTTNACAPLYLQVLEEAVYDALFAASANAFAGSAGSTTLGAGAITATVIATGAIDADAIADNAIDAGAIAANAITADKIANGAIDAATFAADVDAEARSWLGLASANLDTQLDALPTAAEVVNEWETQSQADPTGFHVNVMEIGGTAQTANDNGADINAILADTADMQPKLGTVTDLGSGATLAANNVDMAGATFSTSTDSQEAIRNRGDAAWTTGGGGSSLEIASGTIGDTGNDTTHLHLEGLAYSDDALNDLLIVVYDDSAGLYYSTWITDWANTGDLATVNTLPFTPENDTDTYVVLAIRQDVTGGSGLDAAGVRAAIGLASANLDTQLATAQSDLNTITGTAGVLIDAGTGAGQLSISSGLLAWNPAWDTEVQSKATDALNAYDPPTNAEMEARTLVASAYFDPSTDTVTLADGVTHGGTTAMLRLGSTTGPAMHLTTTHSGSGALQADGSGGGVAGIQVVGGSHSAIRVIGLDTTKGIAIHTLLGTMAVGIDVLNSTVDVNADITGNLSGSVGSVTGGINTSGGTITTLDALDTAQDSQHSTTHGRLPAALVNNRMDSTIDATGLEAGALALINAEVDSAFTTQMADSVNADGSIPTREQALYLLLQFLTEFVISGTTYTVRKVDGSTTLATFTLDDDTDPTGITRS